MNLLFFLTPKQDVLFIYEDFTLRQTLEKWSNQRFATIPVLKRNGEYLGTMTEGDILWGIKSIHGLDIDASEDIPIASFPRRRDYKAVPVTTDMHALLNAAVDQNFVPVVDDRNVFIGIVRRTAILQQVAKDYESPKGNVYIHAITITCFLPASHLNSGYTTKIISMPSIPITRKCKSLSEKSYSNRSFTCIM